MNDTSLVILIPTIGRYDALKRLFDSIRMSSVHPAAVYLLDSSSHPVPFDRTPYPFMIRQEYLPGHSLTQARNRGIQLVKETARFVCFLDDDVILLPGALETMAAFWQTAGPDIGGACFNIIDRIDSRRFWRIARLFCISDNRPGAVLCSGFQTPLGNLTGDTFTQWLPGGVTVWRREVFDRHLFDRELPGYGYIEDVDFSYQTGKRYRLIALAGAKALHEPHPIGTIDFYTAGRREVLNRKRFIGKHREFSRFLFYWAVFGKVIEHFAMGIVHGNTRYLRKAAGYLAGCFQKGLT